MLEKKIDTNGVACVECGNADADKLLLMPDAPWVVECCVCGHPNDARWDDDGAGVHSD